MKTVNPDEIKIEIGKRIRLVREQADLSMRDTAKALGIGLQTLFRYEHGVRCPTADLVVRILHLGGDVSPVWLLTGQGEMIAGEEKSLKDRVAVLENTLSRMQF